MRRRDLLIAVGALVASPKAVRSQPAPRRIGLLSPLAPGDIYGAKFLRGMRELGYAAGKDFVLVERYADGREDRLTGLADELAQLRVDLIFASTTPAARAAQQATASIPVVFVAVSDPVKMGLAETLRRP